MASAELNFKCDYCNATLGAKATLVHTERFHGLWDLDCSMCANCFSNVKGILERVKSQKSWTGWTAPDVDALRNDGEALKSKLHFLGHKDELCDRLMTSDPVNEVVTVTANGCEPIRAHRSVLISRSAAFKSIFMSEDRKRKYRGFIALTGVQLHPASFRAFIDFLYTAKLSPEVLKDHASELMTVGNGYGIDILKRQCEDYIVDNMTQETALKDLIVGYQCKSTAVRAAAVGRIKLNPEAFDFGIVPEKNINVLADAFKYMVNIPQAAAAEAASSKDPPIAKQESEHHPQDPAPEDAAASGNTTSEQLAALGSSTPMSRSYAVDSSRFISRGTCTCSVHPFAHVAHSAPPLIEFPGLHFNAASVQQSAVHYMLPPAA